MYTLFFFSYQMPPKQQKRQKQKKNKKNTKTPLPSCKYQHRNQPALDRFGLFLRFQDYVSNSGAFGNYCTDNCPVRKQSCYSSFFIHETFSISDHVYIRMCEHEDRRPITRSHPDCKVSITYIYPSEFGMRHPKVRRWKDCFRRLSLHMKKRFHNKRFAALETAIHPVTNHKAPTDVLNVIANYL